MALGSTTIITALQLIGVACNESPWRVLVLGGTGFKGSPTVKRLVEEGHDVTVVSRNNSYWGFLESFRGLGTVWNCNRTLTTGSGGMSELETSGLALCKPLIEDKGFFDAVVDFNGNKKDEVRQAMKLLKDRVGIYVFISSHSVYDVTKKGDGKKQGLKEEDAVRPGREVSPLERYTLKSQSTYGDAKLECEETLLANYNSGGFPFASLRIANPIGTKENSIRYWLLHLWLKAHLALTMPMHLDEDLLDTPISLTYTPDIAQAVVRVIKKHRNETCCPRDVRGEAFNLAAEQAPTQKELYNIIGDPIGVPFVETIQKHRNSSVVLYPEVVRGHLDVDKALGKLRWSPTDLSKAIRSVARFYDRVMLDKKRFDRQSHFMYEKVKHVLGSDGPRFVSWIRAHYDERRKTELYDEFDDEDEDDLLLVRPDPEKAKSKTKKKKSKKNKKKSEL